ncbi:MAG: uroporphyrinogen decarboxylase family protein [Planctomycetota bacterium]
MTSRERFQLVFEHKNPDRVPMQESPWRSTVERWRTEGLPDDVSVGEYFGLDTTHSIGADNSPRYEAKVLEETDEYTVRTTQWGATLKGWKHAGGVPEFLDFTVTDGETWQAAKERIRPDEDRVDWKRLEEAYPRWQEEGAWIVAGGWFGYDVASNWFVGTERLLMAMVTDPDWCADIFRHMCEVQLELFDLAWDRGYRFDCLRWPDDLGYRNGLLFSPQTYRDVLKPVHKRACDWAHDKGAVVMLHSCGNVMDLIPDLLDAGIDGLNPFEIKAGMDPLGAKREFGDQLVIEGGIDVRLMSDPDAIEDEVRTKVSELKRDGGYIFHSDHSVPDSVSLADYTRVIELARECGRYGA